MAAEGARGRKFAQFVADHVFGHIDRDMAAAIVHRDGMPHHLREDGQARDQVLMTFFSLF